MSGGKLVETEHRQRGHDVAALGGAQDPVEALDQQHLLVESFGELDAGHPEAQSKRTPLLTAQNSLRRSPGE
jgi:hypothetical protein